MYYLRQKPAHPCELFYISDFSRLWSLQSICPFSKVVCPPLLHGILWSACISSKSHFISFPSALHIGQIPCCLSYKVRFSLSVNARIDNTFSFVFPLNRYSYIPFCFVISSSCKSKFISFFHPFLLTKKY